MTSSSWYRRSVWSYKGNREYTRSGYEAAKLRFIEEDLDVDCTDRHYMITGSNSGLGLQVALEVAKRGGVIHMVCRNEEDAKKARSEIITTTGNDKIHLHIVDLSQPRHVVLWVEKFAAQHDKLHALVNNAGCMVHERHLDEDGVETNFAVNTLAVHIITTTLIPLLQRSEDARVVTVSSAGLLNVRLDPHDLMHLNMEPFVGTLVYSQNKRQQVVMTLWYAQRYDKIHFSSMHPGWADTKAVRNSIPQFYETMKDNLRTPAQGADTVVWLAISKAALKHPSGLFFQDREPVPTHLPLAWTKSAIEEEDLLMKNIHDIYLKVHERAYKPPAPQASVEPKKETETATQESASTVPSSNTTPPKETQAEVEIVKLPPPPAPRRDEPQNPPALTKLPDSEPAIEHNREPQNPPALTKLQDSEPVTEHNREPQNPPASAKLLDSEPVTEHNREPERSSSIEVIAEDDGQVSSPEPYVSVEKPVMGDIAGTHRPITEKQQPSETESTMNQQPSENETTMNQQPSETETTMNQQPTETETTTPSTAESSKLESSDQLASAITDMKVSQEANSPTTHTQPEEPTKEKVAEMPHPETTPNNEIDVNKEASVTPHT